MYQMSPDMPRRMYADRLRSWEQERNARRVTSTYRSATPAMQRRTAWRAFAPVVSARRALSAEH